MRARILGMMGAVVLAGCGGGREQLAAQACDDAIRTKLAGRGVDINLKDLAAHAAPEGADALRLLSTIVFDKGLSSEYKQTAECKVRFEEGKPASVIFLQFNWSMDDVKKD
ncbi:MAG: hypothetical protein ABI411_09970 [Tahibacter sp.]